MSPEHIVLVIDDDPVFAEFMAKTIEAIDYRTAVALNGPEGVRLAKALAPVLIFCDLSMPGLGGIEVFRILSEDSTVAHVPRVLVSGYACPLRGVAADAFLAKPVTAEAVHRAVRSFAQSKPTRLSFGVTSS